MERAFRSERLRGLLTTKGIRADDVSGFSREMIAKWENGHGQPSLEALRDLAIALESTTDYLVGIGPDYRGSFELAAAQMSFAYFERDVSVKPQSKERCRKIAENEEVLELPGAPRSVAEWKTVSRMLALVMPSPPAKLTAVKKA